MLTNIDALFSAVCSSTGLSGPPHPRYPLASPPTYSLAGQSPTMLAAIASQLQRDPHTNTFDSSNQFLRVSTAHVSSPLQNQQTPSCTDPLQNGGWLQTAPDVSPTCVEEAFGLHDESTWGLLPDLGESEQKCDHLSSMPANVRYAENLFWRPSATIHCLCPGSARKRKSERFL